MRDVIEHEDALIDNRLRWMFTLMGFLFAGIAISVNAEVNLIAREADIAAARFADMQSTLAGFRIAAALIGMISAAVTLFGLLAAELAITAAAIAYRDLTDGAAPHPFAPIGGEPTNILGLTPGAWFCITLFGTWFGFLLWVGGAGGAVAAFLGALAIAVLGIYASARVKPNVDRYYRKGGKR